MSEQERSEPIDASVIVCTYNRAASLRDTIGALLVQRLAPGVRWELVVVDNNSRDDTATVVRQFQHKGSSVEPRYAFEPAQGLSKARNHGIGIARGAVLAFTDDDVLPEADWLQTIIDEMRRTGCDACGGYIEPLWERAPPAWLTERFFGFLALRPDTSGPRFVDKAEDMPFGANMAFRHEVFERIGNFDPALGRSGTNLAGSEEIDVFERLVASGGKVLYVPTARVKHKVEAFRTHKRYFRRWRYQGSRNLALNRGVAGARRLHGVPPYLLLQFVRSVGSSLVSRLTMPADEAFRQEMIAWHFAGLIAGARARHRRQRPGA